MGDTTRIWRAALHARPRFGKTRWTTVLNPEVARGALPRLRQIRTANSAFAIFAARSERPGVEVRWADGDSPRASSVQRFDASNSSCRISTRREGMLSAVGHDLEIRVDAYVIEIDEDPLRVLARFDARSVHVLGTVEGGRLRIDKLSDRDRAQIDRQIADDVLASDRFPVIEFTSTAVTPSAEGYEISGELRLRGASRSLRLLARRVPAGLELHATIHQPDFGIKPFRALGGTLRVHPEVGVLLTTPAPMTRER